MNGSVFRREIAKFIGQTDACQPRFHRAFFFIGRKSFPNPKFVLKLFFRQTSEGCWRSRCFSSSRSSDAPTTPAGSVSAPDRGASRRLRGGANLAGGAMATHERTPLIEPDSAAARRGASRPRSVSRLASVGALGALAVVAALTGTTRAVTRALASAGDDDVFAVGVFDDVPELRAEVRVEGLDRPLTLPWQPVSLPGGRSREPLDAFGAVSGHGLHCDMRAMAWLFADVPADIPTAVFARARVQPSRLETERRRRRVAGGRRRIRRRERFFRRAGRRARGARGVRGAGGRLRAVADAAGYETFVAVGESQSTAAAPAGRACGRRRRSETPSSRLRRRAALGEERVRFRIRARSHPRLVLTLVPSMGAERSSGTRSCAR